MAEVGILIIFVLLLLLARGSIRERELTEEIREAASVREKLGRSAEAEAQLAAIRGQLGMAQDAPIEEIQRLLRVALQAAAHADSKDMLDSAMNELEAIRRARQDIERTLGSPDIARQVQDQSFRLAAKEHQLLYLEKRLEKAGEGKGARPCWVQPDGTIDFLFDVVLTSEGIRLRERRYARRNEERSHLPLPEVDPDKLLSKEQFLALTAPLYDRSQQDNCRFFVVIFDGTRPEEKALYKSLLRTVEGHFYKRLDDGPAPF